MADPTRCPYGEMEWFCALAPGHEGPHRSDDLSSPAPHHDARPDVPRPTGDAVEAIRQRAAAASPAPWRWAGNTDTGDLYLMSKAANWRQVLGTVRIERTPEDRVLREIRAHFTDEPSRASAVEDYLFDSFGTPRYDTRLAFVVDDWLLEDARKLAVFEVAPDAVDREDPRVYRADIVGLRHPDAEFIANARADVDTLLAEVDRLRGAVTPNSAGPTS